MKLSSTNHFGACHLVVALRSPTLTALLRRDAEPRSDLLAQARLRLHDAVGPNFIGIENSRKAIVQQATEIMDMLVPKSIQAKMLKRLRVTNLDSVESIISPAGELFFNGPRGLAMNNQWFGTAAAVGAPAGLQWKLNDLIDKLAKLRAVISVLRYEAREVSCVPDTNAILMAFMDAAMPLIADYHNDCLTHDRDLILKNLYRGSSTFIAIKALGSGTWAGESITDIRALGSDWQAIFEVGSKGVRSVSIGLNEAA